MPGVGFAQLAVYCSEMLTGPLGKKSHKLLAPGHSKATAGNLVPHHLDTTVIYP